MRTIIMINKDKAVELAVTYSGYQDASAEFCSNPCKETANSLWLWAGMLDDLQDVLQIAIADKQQLLNAIDLANKFNQ